MFELVIMGISGWLTSSLREPEVPAGANTSNFYLVLFCLLVHRVLHNMLFSRASSLLHLRITQKDKFTSSMSS